MITLFFSSQARLTSDMAKRFIKENYPSRDETNFASFNMAVTPIKELVSECESLSLFAQKKAIVASDCFFLKKGKGVKLLPDDSLAPLERYCLNPNPDIDLLLLYFGTDLDEKSKVVEAIRKNGAIKEIKEPSEEELLSNAKKRLAKIGAFFLPGAGEEFIARIDLDYARYCSEMEKILLYSGGNDISVEEIKALVAPKLDNDVFKMSNALLRNDVASAFKIYYDLKTAKNDEIALLSLLSSSFQFMERVYFLSERGLSSRGIANELSAKNTYRIDITLKSLRQVDGEKLPLILEDIYQASYAILSGKEDPGFAFSRFLANY